LNPRIKLILLSWSPIGNKTSPCNINQYGTKATSIDKYNTSKTLAEHGAWVFVSKFSGKDDFNLDLVVINPPFIFSPVIHQMKDIDMLNESNTLLCKAVTTQIFL
jgi:hypothetical protein